MTMPDHSTRSRPGTSTLVPRLSSGAALGLLIALGAGCAGVEPYERENLATHGMRADRDPLAGHLQDHLYFSREASNGGGRVGGGGCGCN